MTSPRVAPQRSSGQLLRATLTAALVAALILVTTVLPAEYGLDPSGAGRALGIVRPSAGPFSAGAASSEGASSSAERALLKSPTSFRSDEMTVDLEPGEGAEVKASMAAGQRLVFSWVAEGPVDVDMHGEAAATAGGAHSYWKEGGQSSGHGAFEAPFAGAHGWFWQNLGAASVKVRVKTSGFYEKLYRP
jgi:hypothetical protein